MTIFLVKTDSVEFVKEMFSKDGDTFKELNASLEEKITKDVFDKYWRETKTRNEKNLYEESKIIIKETIQKLKEEVEK